MSKAYQKCSRIGLPFRLILVFSALYFTSCSHQPTTEISLIELPVSTVELKDIPIFQSFVGQTYGAKDVDIIARVDGVLEGFYFKEGSRVKAGQLLYKIDQQPLLAREASFMSMLAQAKTMLAKAESDLNRIRPLAETNAVSQRDLDAAVAQYDAAKSNVEAAEANLRASQIELGYTLIKAPINGIIGISKATTGEYVGRAPNAVVLNTISKTDTIKVKFYLNENEYIQLVTGQENEAYNKKFAEEGVRLYLADNSLFPHRGWIEIMDRGLDPNTGSILLQAAFPNPDGIIRPGQFARIELLRNYIEQGISIPKRSVREMQTMYQIYVLDSNNIVTNRMLEVGHAYGQQLIVKNGLEVGERYIAEGFEKVVPGMPVKPMPTQGEIENKK
ncbi:MAG: efflux RND transporter periplasmic adaptor subunit [Bacteroidales bacterium]|jgi:membrane fusion protein (multidrug efflux system)|nr:efflux RND transporter periplasmic adaptor subunit [Bacteroidales bacterium]HOI32027.1 efflux RND transporter periplasmic adaptor subunit [Bacteroidales bacterium]